MFYHVALCGLFGYWVFAIHLGLLGFGYVNSCPTDSHYCLGGKTKRRLPHVLIWRADAWMNGGDGSRISYIRKSRVSHFSLSFFTLSKPELSLSISLCLHLP